MTSVRSFDEDGVAILRDAVPLELVARVRDEIDELLPPGPMRRGRVENAWRRRTAIRELAMAPPVIALLRDLYGRRPIRFRRSISRWERNSGCTGTRFTSIRSRTG